MRAAVFWILAGFSACAIAAEQKKIVCYFGSWAVYRPSNGAIDIDDIDSSLCTHLIYTFVGLADNGAIKSLDPWADLPSGRDGFNKFNALRNGNPRVKTLVAIGGWNEGSVKYSRLAADPKLRANFVENAVAFVRQHGFNGLDFDWEYPNQRGGVPKDRENYVQLLKELRKRFDEEGLLLTAAVGAAQQSAEKSYLVKEVVEQLHFVNLMAYDLHGSWEKTTGINAPLFPGAWEKGAARLLNVEAAINYWLSQGATPEKIVLGVPFYGRSFSLNDPSQNEIGSPADSPGVAGPYTREPGTLGYNEICESQLNGGWEVHFEEEQRVPYAYKQDQWVGYENPRSIKEKAELVNRLGLGGAMVWSVETDDFRGICGAKYPLLKTLNHVLRGGPALPPASNTTRPPSSTDEPSVVKCTGPGFMPDPKDCSIFYMCVKIAEDKYDPFLMRCPAGLHFDPNLFICNYPDQVNCGAK